ncbi:MAG: cytochrome c [Dongiaceae bacterium]
MKSIPKGLLGIVALALLGAGPWTAANAADDPATIVVKRQALMKQQGAMAKAINEYVESGAGEPADVLRYAMTFRAISLAIPDLFPAGTSMDDGVGKTGAKPAIWADWAGFQAAAAKFGEEGGKLADAALTGDKAKIAEQFASFGKNGCGGCHTPFRQKLE